MNRLHTYSLFTLIVILLTTGFGAPLSGAIPGGKVKVMIIGSHYLPADMMKSTRQKEMSYLVESLSHFQADRILLDIPYNSSWEKSINQTYKAFLAGEYTPNRTAREQLGFRLAQMMGIRMLYGIDVSSGFDLGSALREASAKGDTDKVGELIRKGKGVERAKLEHANTHTLSHYFSYLNHSENLRYEHGLYVKGLSRLGVGQSQVGAHLLANWYEYHMELFSNITRLKAEAGDKILLILDSRHIPILKQLIKDDPDFEWVDPLPYLEVQ